MRSNRFNWSLAFIVILASLPLWITLYRETLPGSHWLDVSDIQIDDAPTGTEHLMQVQREIKRNFLGKWTAEITNASTNILVLNCKGTGENLYRTTDILPRNVKLFRWWFNRPEVCHLPPGRYFVDTEWIIIAPNFTQKTVRKRSNIFTVLPDSSQ